MSLREHRLLFRVLPVPASVRPAGHKYLCLLYRQDESKIQLRPPASHLIIKPHLYSRYKEYKGK